MGENKSVCTAQLRSNEQKLLSSCQIQSSNFDINLASYFRDILRANTQTDKWEAKHGILGGGN